MRMPPVASMLAVASLALATLALASCRRREPPMTVDFVSAGATAPFSSVVRVGRMLYLSGQVGADSTGKLAPGGIDGETRQALENIKRTLERNGSSMDRVVKCTVMLADMGEWGAMNKVYVPFFPEHRPARSAFGASGLALNARVEIECMALAG